MESVNKDDSSSLYYIIEKLAQSITVKMFSCSTLVSSDSICIIKGLISCGTTPSGTILELKKEKIEIVLVHSGYCRY